MNYNIIANEGNSRFKRSCTRRLAGQYERMMRWAQRFKEISSEDEYKSEKTLAYFDIMFACFQNIFFLKDWLSETSIITKRELNLFINSTKEIGICRDICNGSKHYKISNASVDNEFGIIRNYDPFHKVWGISKYHIVIYAESDSYKPYELILKSIELWGNFIHDRLGFQPK